MNTENLDLIEINNGIFQNKTTGIKYREITTEMIESTVDEELDRMFEPWIPDGPDGKETYPASLCFKKINNAKYISHVIDYLERHQLFYIEQEGKTRFFEHVDE